MVSCSHYFVNILAAIPGRYSFSRHYRNDNENKPEYRLKKFPFPLIFSRNKNQAKMKKRARLSHRFLSLTEQIKKWIHDVL